MTYFRVLSANIVGVLGPAIGGVVVVAASPGFALAVDAASFLVCAELLRRIRVAQRATTKQPGFVAELREGWQEFTSRTWLWASVVLFGVGNLAFAGWIVLGPAIADERLGGAGPWATILTASGIGAVLGGRRTIVGGVLGAVFLIAAGEMLRPLGSLSTFVVSAAALAVILFVPSGLLGLLTRQGQRA